MFRCNHFNMLNVNHIRKRFGQLQALEDVSFNIRKGTCYGLLGPNGAGKSTTIHSISGILAPDSGSILIDGTDLYSHTAACKRKMGVVPQEIALYEDLSAWNNLLFWGSLYDMSKQDTLKRAAILLDWVGLADRKNDLIAHYSGGMKRRINIAAALMHDPDLILMDEPTVGIDPQSRNHIYTMLQDLRKEGKTILYTTHYMQEAEELCDEIGIIDNGQVIASGTLEELRHQHPIEESLHVHFSESVTTLTDLPWTHQWEQDHKKLIISSRQTHKDLAAVIQFLDSRQISPEQIKFIPINLETIFLHLTGRTLRD